MILAGLVFGILFYGVICRFCDMVNAAKHAGFRW